MATTQKQISVHPLSAQCARTREKQILTGCPLVVPGLTGRHNPNVADYPYVLKLEFDGKIPVLQDKPQA